MAKTDGSSAPTEKDANWYFNEAEMAMMEVKQLTEAARYIVEAQNFIEEAERLADHRGTKIVREGTCSPGDLDSHGVPALLYQAWNRIGVAHEAMLKYHAAVKTPRAA